MSIKVVAHEPDWHQRFLEEAEKIHAVLGDQVIAIHHIGSSAITPAKAKPIIDILPEVVDIEKIALKERLARQYPDDREAYTLGKTDFIHSIDLKAKEWKRNR
jgi:GrpB-like predicted nucleotidyltransferase (UPF0157 family)